MPHVVLDGNVEFRNVFESFKPLFIRNGDKILKTSTKYIDSEEKSILVEALAVEKNSRTSFLALISRREDGVVVRIHPHSNIEKTAGVKMILVEIAKQLLNIFPKLKVGKTNLQDFLRT